MLASCAVVLLLLLLLLLCLLACSAGCPGALLSSYQEIRRTASSLRVWVSLSVFVWHLAGKDIYMVPFRSGSNFFVAHFCGRIDWPRSSSSSSSSSWGSSSRSQLAANLIHLQASSRRVFGGSTQIDCSWGSQQPPPARRRSFATPKTMPSSANLHCRQNRGKPREEGKRRGTTIIWNKFQNGWRGMGSWVGSRAEVLAKMSGKLANGGGGEEGTGPERTPTRP